MLNILLTCLVVMVLILSLFIGGLVYQQRRFIYFPEPFRTSPVEVGLQNISEIELETPDRETIIAWYSQASAGKPTFLYFHGNGGSLRYRADRIMLMQREGYGVLIVSYRGYGGSTGSPTEKNIISDALMSYQWLVGKGIEENHIILYGESLGSGVAVQLAAQRKTACIILEAPYTSLPDLAKIVYPYLPTALLMKDHFDSTRHISKIGTPLLILHGAMDSVIPSTYGKKLFELASQPKAIEVFPFGTHSDLYLHGAWDKIRSFMKVHCPELSNS